MGVEGELSVSGLGDYGRGIVFIRIRGLWDSQDDFFIHSSMNPANPVHPDKDK
jgi:hypothetical protein